MKIVAFIILLLFWTRIWYCTGKEVALTKEMKELEAEKLKIERKIMKCEAEIRRLKKDN